MYDGPRREVQRHREEPCVGDVTVTVTVGAGAAAASGQVTVRFRPVTIELTATPAGPVVAGTQVTLQATVKLDGVPYGPRRVAFKSNQLAQFGQPNQPGQSTCTTDAATGMCSVTATSAKGATVTFTATAYGTNPEVSATQRVTFQPLMSITFSPAPPTAAATGTQVALRVEVKQDGAVPAAPQQVDFTVDTGTLSAASCMTSAALGICSVNVTLGAAGLVNATATLHGANPVRAVTAPIAFKPVLAIALDNLAHSLSVTISGGSVSVFVNGVTTNATTAVIANIAGITITGGTGADDLTAPDGVSIWTLTGPDAGTLQTAPGGPVITFTGIETLEAGSGANQFVDPRATPTTLTTFTFDDKNNSVRLTQLADQSISIEPLDASGFGAVSVTNVANGTASITIAGRGGDDSRSSSTLS